MFSTIIWATDGSEQSDSTLPIVTELASIHDSKVIAVHIGERFVGGRFGGGPLLADEDSLRQKIESQVDDLRQAGFDATLKVVSTYHHDIAALIVEEAAAVGADLIVVGTHGYGELGTLLHGSTSGALTRTAHCPVLVVPPVAHREPAVGAAASSAGS